MQGLIGVLLVLGLQGAPEAAGALCPGPDGRYPVVTAGQERQLRDLFAPHVAGEPMAGADGWIFRSIAVDGALILARVESPDGATTADLPLRPVTCRPEDPTSTLSFAVDPLVPVDAPPAARAAADQLVRALRANDRTTFWTAWLSGPPAAAPPAAPDSATATAAPPWSAPVPWYRSNRTVALALALALLALLIDLPALARDTGLTAPGGGRVVAALLGLTAAALAVRVLADPTFIREAYPFPSVFWLGEGVRLDGPVSAYPRGPDLVVALLGPLLQKDPYAAWFAVHVVVGTLAVPFAFSIGASLGRDRAAGLVAAALLAFWPQHVRVSASEATHVHLVTWALIALAATLRAAETGRLRPFLVAATAATAAVLMRPEGALILPGLAVVALAHGAGVRSRLRSPVRLAAIAALLALLWPTVATILGDESTTHFAPGGHDTSQVSLSSLGAVAHALVSPDGRNALFDAQTAPLWLWPLTLWGAVAAWRRGLRGAAVGLSLWLLTYLLLFVEMPPAVTVWKMARYHASLLAPAVALAGVGVWDLTGRVGPLAASDARRAGAGVALAALGCAAWWPAVASLPLDWQLALDASVDLGRDHPELGGDAARIVTPDNRRRFLDLQPRAHIVPLTRGRQDMPAAVTVEHALRALHVGDEASPAWFYGGAYCWLAVAPGEAVNPQCEAMARAFELTPIAERTIDAAPYLVAYAATRVAGPVQVTLYRVGARRLDPEAALRLLPEPIEPGEPPFPGYPMAAPTAATMEPPVPRLGESLAPHLHGTPWRRADPPLQ